jgi:tRNA (mo5U34)-methyltransferase
MIQYSFRDVLKHPYWRHRIDLGDGRFTPGTKDTTHWEALGLPEDLSGKTVLDIGAFDGLHSFEAERRGAEKVLATDVWDESSIDRDWWNSLRPGKRGFDIAHSILDSDVDSRKIGVEEISPETVGKFDLVMMSGVIYHLKEPLTAIENAASVAEERLVVESAITREFSGKPVMKFLRGRKLDKNPSNWWQPSLEAVEKMVLSAGVEETNSGVAPLKEAERKNPEIRYGEITQKTGVYRSPELEDEMDRIDVDKKVKCLMNKGGVERVEYRDGEAKIQGWIPKSVVDYRRDLDLSEDTPRGVVHGYL